MHVFCENEKRDNLLHANFAPAAKLLHTIIGPLILSSCDERDSDTFFSCLTL